MSREDLLDLFVLIILIMLSGFFSSAETAMTTVNKIRIKSLADEGNKRARTMEKILDHSPKMLSAILIGNNVVNLYATSLSTTFTMRVFGSAAVGIATGIMTLIIVILGEITPKTMAAANAEKLSLLYANVVWGLMVVLTPVIFLVNAISRGLLKLLHADADPHKETLTKQELQTMVDVGHEDGILENQEHEVISNVLDFISSQVKEVMTPRIDMVMVSEENTYDEVLEVFRRDKFTRLPVYRGTTENVIGIINIKDFMFCRPGTHFHVDDIMYEPYYTYEFKKTSELLMEMRKKSISVTIVLDEYGQAVGMVTLEDLLEELVGEIRDEYDEDEKNQIRRTGPGEYQIEGSVKLDDLNDAIGTNLDSEDYDSIGGYVIGKLDHLPRVGEKVVTPSGDTLIVRRMDKNRIDTVTLRLKEESEPAAEPAFEESSKDSAVKEKEAEADDAPAAKE